MAWSLKKTFATTGALVSLLAVVALGGTLASMHQSDAARDAGARRYQSFLLADELRQSSDDLTRLARTFVVSGGEAKWEQQYFEILDIRNGKKPRPGHYERIYWDFRAAGTDAAAPTADTVPLLDLMKRAGFTAAELAKPVGTQDVCDWLEFTVRPAARHRARELDALRLELERELGYRNDLSMDHVLGCERLLRFLATDGSPAP